MPQPIPASAEFRSLATTMLRCLIAMTMICQRAQAAEPWTGWLGPRRNGWIADFKSPEWPGLTPPVLLSDAVFIKHHDRLSMWRLCPEETTR